jgi:integrase
MAHFPKPYFRKSRQLWYVQIDGREHKLGPDRDEAFRRYHQLMAEPPEQKIAADRLTELIDRFLDWVHKHRAPANYEGYRHRLQRFVDTYPKLKVAELRPYHVENWVDQYELSNTTRRNYFRAIKRCLRWAKQQGYVDRNPIEDLVAPTADHREVAFDQSEFDRLLAFVPNPDLVDLLHVSWDTGCRPQESLRVESRHVDLVNHRWVFPRSESKTKRIARIVYLTDRAMEITRRRMLVYPDGPLFRNSNGRPWTTCAVNCGLRCARIRMGKQQMQATGEKITDEEVAAFIPSLKPTIRRGGEVVAKTAAELRREARKKLSGRRAAALAPKFSLYALRHSWATNALQRGVDPLTVAILMGHQDPSTLSKVYQHLSLNPEHMLNQARKAIGQTANRSQQTPAGIDPNAA